MTETFQVRVKLFAAAKQLACQEAVVVELPQLATIATLRAALAEQFPPLAPLIGRAMFSIDLDYATDKTAIPPHAEIACIPPVSGG